MIELDELELDKRLNRMEASNRSMRIVVCGLLVTVFAIGLLAAAQSRPNVVEAQEFRLLDADGQLRATLDLDKHGNSSLTMADSHGTRRIILGTQNGPSLGMFTAEGESVIILQATSKLVRLRMGAGKTGVFSVMVSDGSPMLMLGDSAVNETLFVFTTGLVMSDDGQRRQWPDP